MEWPTVEDPVFGRLRWYADGKFYGGEILLSDGSELLVSFDPEDGEPGNDLAALLTAMLPAAREALRWVLANDERVRRLAAERFTDAYNRMPATPTRIQNRSRRRSSPAASDSGQRGSTWTAMWNWGTTTLTCSAGTPSMPDASR